MNDKVKVFLLILSLLLILIIYPVLGPSIENIPLNLGIRSFLILIAIYIILILLKFIKKDK